MKIYKFGGASVKNADGVRNLVDIVNSNRNGGLFVVVSAMGKTTNALEIILECFYEERVAEALDKLQEVVDYHAGIISGLWGKQYLPERVAGFYNEIEDIIANQNPKNRSYEVWYDRMVSYGELISTAIVSDYMNYAGVANKWIDMRECFVTNARHKDANIDIEKSTERLGKMVWSAEEEVIVGQGFIGATEDGAPTTIGREGSDYSAAVAGSILNAESVSIWKDVEGILNGDPKIFKGTKFIPELTYLDAIELAYSGAQIIHPKTIKPLQNKNIPLYVKCFLDKNKPGSVIKDKINGTIDIPILILKHNQVLISIKPSDFSFVLEERFSQVFSLLEEYHVKVNLVQSSAVSLSFCIDNTRHLAALVERLETEGYRTKYNVDMELLTIRGYTPEQHAQFGDADGVYLTQRTRRILRIVRVKTI